MKLKEKILQFYKKHTKAFNIIENILIVLLVLVAYALGFSKGVKECSNNQNNSQIEEKTSSRDNHKTRKYRINESKELTNIINLGVLSRTDFGSDSNTITFSNESDIFGTSLVSSIVGVETELQLTNTTSDSVVISYKMHDLFYKNNIIFTDTILLGGYFTADKYLTYFGQYCYFDIYNNGVALIENGTLSKSMNEHTYLFSIDSFTPVSETVPYNYDLTLRFDFNRSSATTTKVKFSFYLFAYNLSELVNDSYLDGYNDAILENKDSWYQEGHDKGYDEGYTGGYIEGNEEGYDNGYNVGYKDAVSTISSVTYSNSILGNYNEFYVSQNGNVYVYKVLNINNDYDGYYFLTLPNSGLDMHSLLLNENLDNSEPLYISSNYSVIKNGSLSWKSNRSNYSPITQINLLDSNDSLVDSFGLEDFDNSNSSYSFYLPTEYFNKYYKIQFLVDLTYAPSNFQFLFNDDNLDYQSGLNQGLIQGKLDVLNNPNNYDLYNQTQVDEIENNSYSDGYSSGLDYVIANPNEFLLYTSSQLREAVEQALQEADKTLSNVWTIIRNAASAVSEVMSIQIMPGISLATLVGIFVGIPLLLWAIKILAS